MGDPVRRYTIEIKDPEGRTVLLLEADWTSGVLRTVIEETRRLAGLPDEARPRPPTDDEQADNDGSPRR